MEKANIKIREAAKQVGVPLWAVAVELGISEASMTRLLRRELPDAEREKVLAAIAAVGRRG